MTEDDRAELIDRLKAVLRPQQTVIQQARIVQAAIALVELHQRCDDGFPETVWGDTWRDFERAVQAYTGTVDGR